MTDTIWFVSDGKIKLLASLLFLGMLLGELHQVVYFYYPETAVIEYALWLDKSYVEKITVLWYLFELSNIIDKVIWAFVLAKISMMVSRRLFKVCVVFIFYYLTQFGFYIWNRNTSAWANNIIYLYMVCIVIYIFIPDRKAKLVEF